MSELIGPAAENMRNKELLARLEEGQHKLDGQVLQLLANGLNMLEARVEYLEKRLQDIYERNH